MQLFTCKHVFRQSVESRAPSALITVKVLKAKALNRASITNLRLNVNFKGWEQTCMLVNGLFMLTPAHLLSVFTSWIIQSLVSQLRLIAAGVNTFLSVLTLINMSKLPLPAFYHIFYLFMFSILYCFTKQLCVCFCLLKTCPTNRLTVFIKFLCCRSKVNLLDIMCSACVRLEAPSSPGSIMPDMSTQTNLHAVRLLCGSTLHRSPADRTAKHLCF